MACFRASLLLACLAMSACGGGSEPNSVASVTVLPAEPTILLPRGLQMEVDARNAAGARVGGTAEWSSSNPAVATVNESGRVLSVSAGMAEISATVEGVTGSTDVTVQVPVSSVAVTPALLMLPVYDSIQLAATVTGPGGEPIEDAPISWESAHPTLAAVSPEGIVSGLLPGDATIYARSGVITGVAVVRVGPARVVRIDLQPPPLFILVNAAEQLRATLYDKHDQMLQGRTIQWASSNPSAIVAAQTGVITGVGAGSSNVTAHVDGASSAPAPIPVVILAPFLEVSSGGYHACGLTSAGESWCWGANDVGQLGDGTQTSPVNPVKVAGGLAWRTISAGAFHTCGITASNQTYCWGRNSNGELGTGNTTMSTTPVQVMGGPYSSISAGGDYTCGVTGAGAAFCWGQNHVGQLGIASQDPVAVPTPVAGGHLFSRIAVGEMAEYPNPLPIAQATCGVRADGDVLCWGRGDDGELGTGDSLSSTVPRLVAGGHSFEGVNVGFAAGCGRITTGAGYCWGANPYGNFGNGTLLSDPRPTVMLGSGYEQVELGYFYGCAIRSAGELVCWGWNEYGALGYLGGGSTPEQPLIPSEPFPDWQFTRVSAGFMQACGVRVEGDVYCWGARAAPRRLPGRP